MKYLRHTIYFCSVFTAEPTVLKETILDVEAYEIGNTIILSSLEVHYNILWGKCFVLEDLKSFLKTIALKNESKKKTGCSVFSKYVE